MKASISRTTRQVLILEYLNIASTFSFFFKYRTKRNKLHGTYGLVMIIKISICTTNTEKAYDISYRKLLISIHKPSVFRTCFSSQTARNLH